MRLRRPKSEPVRLGVHRTEAFEPEPVGAGEWLQVDEVYAGIDTRNPQAPSAYAKAVAEQFAEQTPQLVTAKMAKALREGKVFIDWSQNNPAKTTIAPYSLRGRDHPTVST